MFGKIIGSILIVTGCFFFYKAGAQYHYGKQSLDWPAAPGTVTLSKWGRAGGSQPGYKAKIEYDYTVGGETYHSGFIGFSEFNDPNHAYRFKKGNQCTVYYNPDDPAMSVLVPGYSKLSIGLFLGMGVFFTVFPFLFAFVGRFIQSSDREQQ